MTAGDRAALADDLCALADTTEGRTRINLGLPYGMSQKRLTQKLLNLTDRKGFVITPAGRRRYFMLREKQ